MRIGQIKLRNAVTACIIENDNRVRPIPDYTVVDLIRLADVENCPLAQVAARLATSHAESCELMIPLQPKEVWACGCTYKTSAEFRDGEHGTREGYYAHVYREPRPEIFFKGTSRFCVGPGQGIGIRKDSVFTAPEPELALILGAKGKIHGYTLANDVSAWDIERENMLYLPQSKMYAACCSLGPAILLADTTVDPYALDMSCTIERGGNTIFSGSTSTANLNRKFEQLLEYLMIANPVPAGSVLLTGTGIIVTEEAALAPGDVVTIEVPQIGELKNPAITVG